MELTTIDVCQWKNKNNSRLFQKTLPQWIYRYVPWNNA